MSPLNLMSWCMFAQIKSQAKLLAGKHNCGPACSLNTVLNKCKATCRGLKASSNSALDLAKYLSLIFQKYHPAFC